LRRLQRSAKRRTVVLPACIQRLCYIGRVDCFGNRQTKNAEDLWFGNSTQSGSGKFRKHSPEGLDAVGRWQVKRQAHPLRALRDGFAKQALLVGANSVKLAFGCLGSGSYIERARSQVSLFYEGAERCAEHPLA
jgi:hypothetical protein